MVMPATPDYDVIIIGGGPAGASTATLLAGYGHRVLILEREKFPRYHIGESLIPFTFGPLERLGLVERMKASHFQKKYSVMFIQPDGKRSQPFYFHTRYDINTVAQTWQVLRSEFEGGFTSTVRGVFCYRVDDDGLITNMRGYWNLEGMQFGQSTAGQPVVP